MTTPILPDTESLVLQALREHFGSTALVFVDFPPTWDNVTPLIVAHRVGGTAIDPRFLDRSIIDVQVFAPGRRQASTFARTVRRVLFDACAAGLSDDEGSLSGFRELSGPWCPGPGDEPDVSRFIATYQITARPAQ